MVNDNDYQFRFFDGLNAVRGLSSRKLSIFHSSKPFTKNITVGYIKEQQ